VSNQTLDRVSAEIMSQIALEILAAYDRGDDSPR
jgi:hypothetical protein